MRELVEFTLFPKREASRFQRGADLPKDVFQALRDRWPEFANTHRFSVSLERDSEKLAEILSFLEENGFSANWQRYPSVGLREPGRFQLRGSRSFDDEEIDRAGFLYAVPVEEIADGGHNDDGTLHVRPRSIKKRIALGHVSGSLTSVCNHETRLALEKEGLTGLEFRPVTLEYKGQKQFPPIWQLWSETALPNLRNPLRRCEVGPGAGFSINDIFWPPVPEFDDDSFGLVGGFDAAMTRERLGGGCARARDPLLIISRRLRMLFDQMACSITYTPILRTKTSD